MKYSKEFKEEALKLSDEIGVKKAATQLGLHYYTLAEWRKNRKSKAEGFSSIYTWSNPCPNRMGRNLLRM